MSYCSNCGTKIEETAKFCYSCGELQKCEANVTTKETDAKQKNYAQVQPKSPNKKMILKITCLFVITVILGLVLIYFSIPDIIDIPVQQGYKATYQTIEENASDHDNLEILTAYCYRTKSLEADKILSSYSNGSYNFPDIDYVYKFEIKSDKTQGLKISVYCGYNSKTKECMYFGTDNKYYISEKNHSDRNYRKVINSKFLSDVIEFLY